ncbi:MAG TPA: hypothetical protein PKW80_07200 [Bacteroidales bacterium]|nr:hypothetical protein [Bacteroidales bacterium]
MHYLKRLLYITLFNLLLCSCNEKKQQTFDFPFILDETCLITNIEQDNTIEGTYLKIMSGGQSVQIEVNIPENFLLNGSNFNNWVMSWGNDDVSSVMDNIREIDTIYPDKTIELGKLIKGNGFPEKNQHIKFWNTCPSGFSLDPVMPEIDQERLCNLSAAKFHLGEIVYVYALKSWVMFVSVSNKDTALTCALISGDLCTWTTESPEKPLFTFPDFKNIPWANGKPSQMPVVTDIEYYNYQWYLFLEGYDRFGKKHIGLAVSDGSITGPYRIREQALISPGKKNSWKDRSCFSAKVCRFKDRFIMFYDGCNASGEEHIGMAYSHDMVIWTEYNGNPIIGSHSGWRSDAGISRPVYTEVHGDSIILMITGAMNPETGDGPAYNSNYLAPDLERFDHTLMGIYLSLDSGKTFIPHINNPVLIITKAAGNNDTGGLVDGFSLIRTDTSDYIFYSLSNSLVNNIFMRSRNKK